MKHFKLLSHVYSSLTIVEMIAVESIITQATQISKGRLKDILTTFKTQADPEDIPRMFFGDLCSLKTQIYPNLPVEGISVVLRYFLFCYNFYRII